MIYGYIKKCKTYDCDIPDIILFTGRVLRLKDNGSVGYRIDQYTFFKHRFHIISSYKELTQTVRYFKKGK